MNEYRRNIHLLANSKSGKGYGETIFSIAQKLAHELNVKVINYEIKSPIEIEPNIDRAISAVLDEKNSVLVAAGGDGTVRAIVEKAIKPDVTVAVVPCGTFNFFARTHNIPEDIEQALTLAMTGEPRRVRLGELNKKIFLINASFGLYVDSIEERESMTTYFGRKRIVAAFATLKTLLRPHRLLEVILTADGQEKRILTPMIFIGNNALQLRNISLSVAKCFKQNLLAVVTLKPVRGWELVRVIIRGIMRTLQKEERLDQFCVDKLIIETKRGHQRVALDGEIFELNSPFYVQSLPDALNLILPPVVSAQKELET